MMLQKEMVSIFSIENFQITFAGFPEGNSSNRLIRVKIHVHRGVGRQRAVGETVVDPMGMPTGNQTDLEAIKSPPGNKLGKRIRIWHVRRGWSNA